MGRLALPRSQASQRFDAVFEDRIDYNPGKKGRVRLLKDDYLCGLLLVSDMEVTSGAAVPVISGQGAYGPLGNVTVKASNSKRELVNLPARLIAENNKVRIPDWTDKRKATPLAANTTTAWQNSLFVPITIDEATEKGAVYLGDQGLQVDVELDMLALDAVFSAVNGATISGGWEVWKVQYNAPPPDDVSDARGKQWLDNISYLRQLRIFDTVELTASEKRITLPTSEDYLRIMLEFYDGNDDDDTFTLNAAAWSKIRLRVNDKVDLVPSWTPGVVGVMQDEYYVATLESGLVVIDYMREYNSRRDVLPTDPTLARTLDLYITGTGAHNVHVVLETSVDSPMADKYIKSRARKTTGAKAA